MTNQLPTPNNREQDQPLTVTTFLNRYGWRLGLVLFALTFPALMRAWGQPWNLTPMGSIALFAGAFCNRRTVAIGVTLAAMLINDLTWSLAQTGELAFTFHPVMPFVYGAYVLYVFLGAFSGSSWFDKSESTDDVQTKGERTFSRGMLVGAGALSGSLLFFLMTNFGVWLMYHTYPQTAAGLGQCYLAGLPFLRPTIFADVVFTSLFFGAYAVYAHYALSPRLAEVSVEH